MSLPKIEHPTFVLEIPSTKKKVMFRPFLVKEEKMLLMAKTSDKETDMLLAMKQIINNCALDDEFDINNLSLFDMEYLFIKIRSNSVSDVVEVAYKDLEDEKVYKFSINLNEVIIDWPENVSNIIKITETSGMTLKYPKASIYEDDEFLNSNDDIFFQLIIRCIDKIYDGDDVYDAKNYKHKELEDFVENLDIKVFEQVRNFMSKQPNISYTIKYKNSLGNDRSIELRSLSDFFTLR